MMSQITFTIRFITPLLIHGANSRRPDNIGLTGKSLRGCWRFWYRAMLGSLVDGITKGDLLKREGEVFGSADEAVGAKFKMLVEPLCFFPSSTKIYLNRLRRNIPFEGFKENSKFKISIIPRKNMSDEEIKKLLASIWLWGNLGGIGQRARRGFGSPVIEVDEKNNPFKELNLPIEQVFDDKNKKKPEQNLESYLKIGIKKVFSIFSARIDNRPPHNTPYFIIKSLEQIAVGSQERQCFSELDDALQEVHGNNHCEGLGCAKPRIASPMILRFHKIMIDKKENYLPVVTWCHQKFKDKHIPHDNCRTAYLRGGRCNCGSVLPDLGFRNYLSGSSI